MLRYARFVCIETENLVLTSVLTMKKRCLQKNNLPIIFMMYILGMKYTNEHNLIAFRIFLKRKKK
jgi:hypothetical protein